MSTDGTTTTEGTPLATPPATTTPPADDRKYTQADVNRLMADHKRTLQREATQNREAHEQLRQQVESFLQGRPIEEVREEMEQTAERLRTVEERSKIESSKYQKDLEAAKKTATQSEQRYRHLAIGRSLSDAALPKASTPAAANLIAKELFDRSNVDENGMVTVEMEVEEEGIRIKKKLTPDEAVAILESQPAQYGPLFKSFISGGAALPGTEGIKRKESGKLDIASMTMQQYAELRKKNPNLMQELV